MDPYTQEGHTYRFRLTVQDLAVFLVELAFSNERVGMWSGFVLRKWSLISPRLATVYQVVG